MIFLVLLSRKMIFLFPENIILFFRRKMKDDLSQKIYRKYDIFFKCSQNMVFPKKIALEYDLSCISGKMVFFPGKYEIFSFDRKWKMIFFKKYMEIWYFLYIRINVTNTILPFCKKKQKWSSPEKSTVKADWHSISHSRKSSNDSLYFYGDLHRRFHVFAFQWKNNQET